MSHQDDRHSSTRSAAQAGAGTLRDVSAFSDAAARSYNAIFLTALAIVRDHDTAADITQETFLRAWLKIDTLRDAALLEPWLARIARNTAAQWLRTGQQRSRVLPLISMEEITVEPADSKNPTPRQAAGQAEQNAQLTQAVMALPDDLRQAVLLHYAEGMSPSDIARLNGEAPSTVTRRLEKARGLLRQHLEDGLAAGLAATAQALRPSGSDLQRTLGIVAAAAAIPAVSRAQLLQMVSDTPPPPMINAVTSAAQAATIEEAGIMKSIIAKVGAAKLIAGAAAIAAVGGGVYAVNYMAPGARNDPASIGASAELHQPAKHNGTDASNPLRVSPRGTSNSSTVANSRINSPKTEPREPARRLRPSERVALLKDDLVSTNPKFVSDDGKTSGGTYLDMLVVDGSGFPVEGATLNILQLKYKEENISGAVGLPSDTTGTIRTNGGTITPAQSNDAGIARLFVPEFVTDKYVTRGFTVRSVHPDYTATFADMEFTSVTKIVMTGGSTLQVLPVDVLTSAPVLATITPEFDSSFKPDWERRPDGTIAIRKISGDALDFYLKGTDEAGYMLVSTYQKVKIPHGNEEPLRVPMTQGFTVKGVLSPNVPRPVAGGKIQARSSIEETCTNFGRQEVDIAADGTFQLTNMPGGEVIIAGLTEGFNSTRPGDREFHSPHGAAHRFQLLADGQEYVLPMEPRANLRIKLVTIDGSPAAGAKVRCGSMLCFNNCCENWDKEFTAVSGADGMAEITGVPAAQESQIWVLDGWRIVGEIDPFHGTMNYMKQVKLKAGETLDQMYTVEPVADKLPR